MKSFNSWIVVGVIVVIALSSISAEIHRAKNTPTYQYRLKKPHAGQNVRRVDKDELDNGISKESWFDEKVWGHSRKTWILSCISSALVGTTGIIPLLIIPANCGFNIKSEGWLINDIHFHSTMFKITKFYFEIGFKIFLFLFSCFNSITATNNSTSTILFK